MELPGEDTPGDSVRACGWTQDGWAVTAYLDINRNGTWDRSVSTSGVDSPFCTQ